MGEELHARSIILFNNEFLLVKKFGQGTLRDINHYVCVIGNIYLLKNLGEELQASSIILYNNEYVLVKTFGRGTLREVHHSV